MSKKSEETTVSATDNTIGYYNFDNGTNADMMMEIIELLVSDRDTRREVIDAVFAIYKKYKEASITKVTTATVKFR